MLRELASARRVRCLHARCQGVWTTHWEIQRIALATSSHSFLAPMSTEIRLCLMRLVNPEMNSEFQTAFNCNRYAVSAWGSQTWLRNCETLRSPPRVAAFCFALSCSEIRICLMMQQHLWIELPLTWRTLGNTRNNTIHSPHSRARGD